MPCCSELFQLFQVLHILLLKVSILVSRNSVKEQMPSVHVALSFKKFLLYLSAFYRGLLESQQISPKEPKSSILYVAEISKRRR